MLKLLDTQKIKDGIQYGIGISIGFLILTITSEVVLGLIKLIAVLVMSKTGAFTHV